MSADKVWLTVSGSVCLKGADEVRIQQTGNIFSLCKRILLGRRFVDLIRCMHYPNEPKGFF